MMHDTQAAVDFLRKFHPTDRWTISCFGSGNEIGPTRTFSADRSEAAEAFIEAQQGKMNLYFHVAVPGADVSKKAGKADISHVQWLWLDADMPKGTDWTNAAAVKQGLWELRDRLWGHYLAPTMLIYSGGGLQAYWRLIETVLIQSDQVAIENVERRTRQLCAELGGDNCHNIDRIMRLPGTVNVLTPTKLRAGRKSAVAKLIEYKPNRLYRLDDFPRLVDPEKQAQPRPEAKPFRSSAQHNGPVDDLQRAIDAMQRISCEERPDWIKVGMALQDHFGERGRVVWDDWSRQSAKFDPVEQEKQWHSFGRGYAGARVTLATIFEMSRVWRAA